MNEMLGAGAIDLGGRPHCVVKTQIKVEVWTSRRDPRGAEVSRNGCGVDHPIGPCCVALHFAHPHGTDGALGRKEPTRRVFCNIPDRAYFRRGSLVFSTVSAPLEHFPLTRQ